MKKHIVNTMILLSALLILFAAGCGKQEPGQTEQNDRPSVTASAESVQPEETQAPESVQPEETQAPESVQTEETQEPESVQPEETPEPEQTPEAAPSQPEQTEAPTPAQTPEITPAQDPDAITVEEDGEYDDKEHVALYIHTYGHLPSNYVTKKEAGSAGWDSGEGNLYKVLPGKSIGGDRFGNYEGLLPKAKGRTYYECDINYNPKGKTSGKVSRGPERIIYSNDGLIFYTDDHYNTFEQLY